MDRIKVLLLFGGESSEHDVSVASAKNVTIAIDASKYDVTLTYIDEAGKWYLIENFNEYTEYVKVKQLLPRLGEKSFNVIGSNETVQVDVILAILHGKNGEDGSVQGLAQLLHVPIVGCDMTASSIGMDKLASKEIVSLKDIRVVPYETHRLGDNPLDFESIKTKLGLPLFVKPTRAGSSVGVSKVHDETEFAAAMNEAHRHDRVVLIEKAIKARELEIAVLGTPPEHRVSGVGEIIPGEEFYSYDDKYLNGSNAQAAIPADLPRETSEKLRNMASTVYESLGCSGLARVDFFMDESGEIYFNEINTLPGFTDISMYPKLWQQEGVTYAELIDLLIGDALESATINA